MVEEERSDRSRSTRWIPGPERADAPKYLPSEEEIQKLLSAVLAFYGDGRTGKMKGAKTAKRCFHRERTYAILMTELDNACRIGEILNLKVGDYQPGPQQLTIRESKGREPRVLPVSAECSKALDDWLRVRTRIMRDVPKSEDEGWLFISETGGRVNEGNFLPAIKKIVRWAGLPDDINNHTQRRFSLNKMAKDEYGDLLFAQGMAGHKDPKTTLIYLKIDGDYLRQRHEQVGVVRGLLNSKRSVKRLRFV